MKIIEAPRDAMQGIAQFIPTEAKARFINSLLRVGFDTIDFGSFVSPKAVPQMRDTAEVLDLLDLENTQTKLLAIVGNLRGGETALSFKAIDYLGFPLTVSETFAKLNTNAGTKELLQRGYDLKELCEKHNRELVVYLSMAFGNPYHEEWNIELVAEWLDKLDRMGVGIVQLSDTTAEATPEKIELLFSNLVPAFPRMQLGLHLHTEPHLYHEKVAAAYQNGCRRWDTVINGMGGCPMSENELVGNLRTGSLISYLERQGEVLNLNRMAFLDAVQIAREVFPEVQVRL